MSEEIDILCTQLISYAGEAKSVFIQSIYESVNGDMAKADEMRTAGRTVMTMAHDVHFQLIQKEANEELEKVTLLMVHAEDQFSGAETFGILASQIIETRKMGRYSNG